MENEQWKLLYDGECPLCTRFANTVRRLDNETSIVVRDLHEHFREDSSIPLEKLLEDVHLLSEEGTILRGGDAVAKVITLIPQARPFRWMIESKAGKRSSDAAYEIMARVRRCRRCGRKRV